MDWRLTGYEVYKWLPPFFFLLNSMKNKSIMWAAASLLLSFRSFPADDLFANMHFPLCCRYLKPFIKWNAKRDIFSFLAAWPTKMWNMLFAFHVTSWVPASPSSPLLQFPHLFCFSWFRPEDLTFRWQLFPDLFMNLPHALFCPLGPDQRYRVQLGESVRFLTWPPDLETWQKGGRVARIKGRL